jgi:SGNH domain (fused to AT3 domains)
LRSAMASAARVGTIVSIICLATVGILQSAPVYGSARAASKAASTAQVLTAVKAAQSLKTVPAGLQPGLTNTTDVAQVPGDGAPTKYKCRPPSAHQDGIPNYAFGECVYGDLTGKKLMIVYGDSHAEMWAGALGTIAAESGWRLETFNLPGCPAPDLAFISYTTNAPNAQCTTFHKIAPPAIRAQHPSLVVVTSESTQDVAVGKPATSAQWETGLRATFASVKESGTRLAMIGDIPQWLNDDADCLAAHESSVQDCASKPADALSPNLGAEQAAAVKSGATYISVTPWICGAMCEPVIANLRVFLNTYHLTGHFVQYVSGALRQSLKL